MRQRTSFDKFQIRAVLEKPKEKSISQKEEEDSEWCEVPQQEQRNKVRFYLNCLKFKSGKKTHLTPGQNNTSHDAQWGLIASPIRYHMMTQEHTCCSGSHGCYSL